MSAPAINVRLTADGVQDVVNAFRRVQQEAQETKEKTTLLGQAMEQMGELIPVITIGAAVEKVIEMGKEALESAISIGKLSQEVGASAGTLSVLSMKAHDVGVSQDEMSGALLKLSRNMEQATQGSAKQKQAFDTLGISMKDIKAKNPADMFIEISQRLQTLPEGATRTAVAMQLMGRSAGQLIPMMNEIGDGKGWDEAVGKAKELGLYMSDDLVAQAKKAEEAMAQMQDVTKGFATQFMVGLMPEATAAMDKFAESVTQKGTSGFQFLGQLIGRIGTTIVDIFRTAGAEIGAILAGVLDGAESAFNVIKSGATGIVGILKAVPTSIPELAVRGPSNALSDIKNAGKSAWRGVSSSSSDLVEGQKAIWKAGFDNFMEKFNQYRSDFTTPFKTLTKAEGATGGGKGGSGDGQSDEERKKAEEERKKLIEARVQYEDAVETAELQKQKERDQQSEAQDKTAYDQGLMTLDEYYAAREARINKEADLEENILKQKLQQQIDAAAQLMGKSSDYVSLLIGQGPKAVEAAAGSNTVALSMLKNIAQTRAQIDEDEIKRQTQLQQNDQQRYAAQKKAADDMLSARQRLYELEGETSAAQEIALQKELQQTDELLQKLGLSESQRKEILSRAQANATAKTSISALSQSGSDVLTSVQTATADIQTRASTGAISELEAERQILDLERQRLPELQNIVKQMQDSVDQDMLQLLYLQPGTDEYKAQEQVVNNLQKQVDEYSKKVTTLGASLKNTTTLSIALSNKLSQEGSTAVIGFFDDIETGSKSASDAFTDLLKTFETMIVHMIDQMIVYYAMMELIGWAAPNSSLYSSLKSSGPFSGLTGHAAGGYTGNTPTNQISGVVHGQEFVLSAAATKHWGLPLLQAMNAGSVSSVASPSSSGSFASAATDSGDAGSMVQVNIQNNSGQAMTASQKTGTGGQSILDIVVGQVATNISSGGSVAQAIQSTYSVSRKGVRRG